LCGKQREMSEAAEKPAAKDRRRDEILAAAFREFSEKGYAGTSMEAIARRASASKETLYAWFRNKETLFNTMFAARLDRLSTRVIPAAERDPSPQNVLPIIAEDVIRFMLVTAPLSQSMVGATGRRASRRMGKTIAAERQNFVNYLNWCRNEGYIDFDDDPFEIASLFVAMAQGEWMLRLATGMTDALTDKMIETHARRVTRIFLTALAPTKQPSKPEPPR
jgi:AcrR family transcriptional regulator